jgi:hypothetical protein
MPVVGTDVEVPGPVYILYNDGGRNYAMAVTVSALPSLSITQSGHSVTISWPAAGSDTLLQTTNLAGAIWTTNTSFILDNGANSLTIASPPGNLFFKLRSP